MTWHCHAQYKHIDLQKKNWDDLGLDKYKMNGLDLKKKDKI
jgi:hypothetical protein